MTTTCSTNHQIPDVRQAALDYWAGWRVIPVGFRSKKPAVDDWRNFRLTYHNFNQSFPSGVPRNVGVVLGQPSGGLVDVDLDCEEAVRAAPFLLPRTAMISGRPGNPRSHYFYVVDGATKVTKFAGLVEIRGDGGQTVIPPSTHVSGEPIQWYSDGEPANVSLSDLVKAVKELAACALLARHWPGEGSRQNASMALAGGLRRAGWDEARIEVFFHATLEAAQDVDEVDQRLSAISPTVEKVDDDEPATGWTRLEEYVGKDVVKKVREWLDVRPEAPTISDFTDLQNAEYLIHRHGQDLRYVLDWKAWMVWGGKTWAKDANNVEVLGRAVETAKHMAGVVADQIKGLVGKEDALHQIQVLRRYHRGIQDARKIEAMTRLAKAVPGAVRLCPDDLDHDPWLLNAQNGTVDLRTGELRDFRREDYITQLAPVAYDPHARCPLWEKFIHDIMGGRDDMVEFLRKAVGYSISGSTREQCLFFCHGSGSNGKSTMVNTLLSVLGDYGIMGRAHTLMTRRYEAHPTELTVFYRKRFVGMLELKDGVEFDEGIVKQLTGSDPIPCRGMGENFWVYSPTHTIWLGGNHRPKIKDTSPGIWRRMKLVPFNVRYWDPDKKETGPEALRVDKTLPARLMAEAPGILAWAVRGCVDYLRNGLPVPDEVLTATQDYREEQDDLTEFYEARCQVRPEAVVPALQVYNAYREWARRSPGDHRDNPLGRNSFYDRVAGRFTRVTNSKTKSVEFQGLLLREE